ncbi:MAG: branched-chain amino acid ABC transporter permease [Desulfomonilia bacterium]|jgi:branched-chain amino acid transport system permease protein|uniref:Branched-chain amino acid ABC transporter permease n=1 Tax=anaerobic digester metagenome TaxID=1263854 RepID=A0A485M4E9_9ZZZZ
MEINASLLASLVISGMARGMIYFLLSCGLTIIFGVMGVVNFAHGAFYMLAFYITFTVANALGFWSSLIIAPIVMILIGAVVERGLFQRVYKAGHVFQLLLSVGIIHVISDIVRLLWGLDPKNGNIPDLLMGCFDIFGMVISKYNIFIIGISSVIAVVLITILYKSKAGSIIRACVYDEEMTRGLGINVSGVFSLVFMAGIGMAAVAAAIAYPITSGTLGMDAQMIIIAFCVTIIGGVGSIGGALVAGLVIAVVESLGILVLPQYADTFIYLIVVAVLFFRPQGIFSIE